jgi:hypothetical protein
MRKVIPSFSYSTDLETVLPPLPVQLKYEMERFLGWYGSI